MLIKSYGKLVLSSDVHDDDQSDNSHSVVTLAYSNVVVQAEKKLPIWVYISSVLIGLGLLLLCTVAFWMVIIRLISMNSFGFFYMINFDITIDWVL